VSNLKDFNVAGIPGEKKTADTRDTVETSSKKMQVPATGLDIITDSENEAIGILALEKIEELNTPPVSKEEEMESGAEEFVFLTLKELESLDPIAKSELEQKTVVIIDKRRNPLTGFESKAKIIDNQLVIVVSEWYDVLTLPKEHYSYVVDVMNEAADFNALVLVLEKK
jgi:hypothetical protein